MSFMLYGYKQGHFKDTELINTSVSRETLVMTALEPYFVSCVTKYALLGTLVYTYA